MKGLGSFLALLLVMVCLLSTSSLGDDTKPHPLQPATVETATPALSDSVLQVDVFPSLNTPEPTSAPEPASTPATAITPKPTSTPWPTLPPKPMHTPKPTPDPFSAFSGTYKVAAGDTLGSIAHKFYTTTELLAQANNITNANRVIIGQVLKVPEVSATAPPQRPKPAATPSPAPPPSPSPAPTPTPPPSSEPETYTDVQNLARMIHSEAHWESYNGKIAVGQCAYDRWKNTSPAAGQSGCWNPGGAKSLSDILTASGQFVLAEYEKVCDNCHQAAKDVMNGSKAYPNSIVTNFTSTSSTDDWNQVPYIGHIGGHAFYGYAR